MTTELVDTLNRSYVSFVIMLGEVFRFLAEEPVAPIIALAGLLLVLVVGVVVLTVRLIDRLPQRHAPPRRAAIRAPHPVAICALSAPDAPGKVQARAPAAIFSIA